MSVLLAVGLLAVTFLAGCVVAVDERRHGEGRYEREDEGGGHYHNHASLYRPYERADR